MNAVEASRAGVVTTTVHVRVESFTAVESFDIEVIVYVYVPTAVGVTEYLVRPETKADETPTTPIVPAVVCSARPFEVVIVFAVRVSTAVEVIVVAADNEVLVASVGYVARAIVDVTVSPVPK